MEERWWKSRTADGKTVEQGWWKWNSRTSDGATVYHLMVEALSNHCKRVEQRCCNSEISNCVTEEHIVEQ